MAGPSTAKERMLIHDWEARSSMQDTNEGSEEEIQDTRENVEPEDREHVQKITPGDDLVVNEVDDLEDRERELSVKMAIEVEYDSADDDMGENSHYLANNDYAEQSEESLGEHVEAVFEKVQSPIDLQVRMIDDDAVDVPEEAEGSDPSSGEIILENSEMHAGRNDDKEELQSENDEEGSDQVEVMTGHSGVINSDQVKLAVENEDEESGTQLRITISSESDNTGSPIKVETNDYGDYGSWPKLPAEDEGDETGSKEVEDTNDAQQPNQRVSADTHMLESDRDSFEMATGDHETGTAEESLVHGNDSQSDMVRDKNEIEQDTDEDWVIVLEKRHSEERFQVTAKTTEDNIQDEDSVPDEVNARDEDLAEEGQEFTMTSASVPLPEREFECEIDKLVEEETCEDSEVEMLNEEDCCLEDKQSELMGEMTSSFASDRIPLLHEYASDELMTDETGYLTGDMMHLLGDCGIRDQYVKKSYYSEIHKAMVRQGECSELEKENDVVFWAERLAKPLKEEFEFETENLQDAGAKGEEEGHKAETEMEDGMDLADSQITLVKKNSEIDITDLGATGTDEDCDHEIEESDDGKPGPAKDEGATAVREDEEEREDAEAEPNPPLTKRQKRRMRKKRTELKWRMIREATERAAKMDHAVHDGEGSSGDSLVAVAAEEVTNTDAGEIACDTAKVEVRK